MRWELFRWVWQLDTPLYVGMSPVGSLNRCRLYLPARTLWGAVTAELARIEGEADSLPNYEETGEELRRRVRFTYLYPAERIMEEWRPWLPEYTNGKGLLWLPELTSGAVTDPQSDREFRRSVLSTRAGTAISPRRDAAEEGSLRETECIQTRWKRLGGPVASPVAMLGFFLTQHEEIKRRLEKVQTVFAGGDARYGLGRMRRIGFEEAESVFGLSVLRDGQEPQVRTSRILAHARAREMRGGLECLAGRDYANPGKVHEIGTTLWTPGSTTQEGDVAAWSLCTDGTWQRVGD